MTLSTKASDPQQQPVMPERNTRGANKSRGTGLHGIVTLARWRKRQTWRLLLITGVGIVAAVMLVCAVPLYSDVSQSAGLRGVISTSYQSSDIEVLGQSKVVSRAIIDQTTQKLNAEFQSKLGPYLKPLEFSVQVPPIQLVAPASLLIVLSALIVICIVALAVMIRVVSRPEIAQTLRLNAD